MKFTLDIGKKGLRVRKEILDASGFQKETALEELMIEEAVIYGVWFSLPVSPYSDGGQAVNAVCLGDGEKLRWDRSDFIGVLDERYLPDWAAEKLAEFQAPQQEQPENPSGGMEMT